MNMVLRSALCVGILTVLLLFTGAIEMRKTGQHSDVQFQPPDLSEVQRALIEQYSQLERGSSDMQDYESLTEPWSPFDDDQWGDQDWSLEGDTELDDDFSGLLGKFMDPKYMDDLDILLRGQPDIQEPEERGYIASPEDHSNEEAMIVEEIADISAEDRFVKGSVKDNEFDESHRLADEKVNESTFDMIISSGLSLVMNGKAFVVSFLPDLPSDFFSSVKAVSYTWISNVSQSLAEYTHSMDITSLMFRFIHSVSENDFVVILKEEIFAPLHKSVVQLYNSYIVEYFSGVRLSFLSTIKTDAYFKLSKYLLKCKHLNDAIVILTSCVVDKVFSFVQKCDNKECLMLAVQSYFQDDLMCSKLVWLAVYTIIALFLLYSTYVSNKAMARFLIYLIRFVAKGLIVLVYNIVGCYRTFFKCKPTVVKSVGSYCAFDENRVRISENRYTYLMAASERKVGQWRRIIQLENQLEELKVHNMFGYLEMYQKQAQLNGMDTAATTEDP